MSFLNELKRRNVIRVGIAYAVISWVLIQVGDILFETLELGPQPAKILLAILLLGALPALVFAWAFEITPEGIKKEKDVARDDSITNMTAKKLDMATIGLLVVAIGLFGIDKLVQKDTDPTSVTSSTDAVQEDKETSSEVTPQTQISDATVVKNSIAVLPFVNMSSDTEQEYFSDGITEEILNALAKVRQLKVAGRTSSFAFKGKHDDLRLIGDTLGVAHILEGSVRKAGNNVRITAQLIKVDDGFHMWSDTYDGSLDNVFDLQEDISRKVTDELKLVMNIEDGDRLASKMTNNVDAYDLFLRGRDHIQKRLDDHIPTGIALLHQAVELDPQFAEAWAVLAEAEAVSYGYDNSIDKAASFARARAHIESAKALDPKLVLPYAVGGLLKTHERGQGFLDGIKELEQALALDPNNALTMRWQGSNYQYIGHFDIAFELYKRAFELEPLSRTDAFNLGANRLIKGDLDAAKQMFEKANELTGYLQDPYIPSILAAQGDHKGAVKHYLRQHQQRVERDGASNVISGDEARQFALGAYGGDETMKAAARESGRTSLNGPDDSAYWQLPEHIQLDNIDRAYEILEEHPDFFDPFAVDFMWAQLPAFNAFRADQRFAPMLEKFGLPVVWNELGWPDICTPFEGTDGSNGQFKCQ